MLDQPTKPATSVVIDDNPEHEGPARPGSPASPAAVAGR